MTASLRVVGFASGSPVSRRAMARIARDHNLVAIVIPSVRTSWRQCLREAFGMDSSSIGRIGAPIVNVRDVPRLCPDIIVSWSYPYVLDAQTLAAASIGALNVHMALLPRHRGIDPIFWTYWGDDREAGVTVHWMTPRIDAGDIAAQVALPLARGLGSLEIYQELSAHGIELLSEVLAQIASGNTARQSQNECLATYESAADTANARVPHIQWPAERVWHVLSGLGDMRSGLLEDAAGRQIEHGRAISYRITDAAVSGRIISVDAGYEIHCSDGIVTVSRRSATR